MDSRVRRQAAILGLAAVLAMWLWQFLTVRYNFGGNWTALFVIAPHMPVPAFLKSEHLYVFPNTQGYDGQVYHLIAHDPWMHRGSADAIVGAAFRYQRILVPALAWCIALGHDPWIHAAYYAVVLAFGFLGVYWLSLVAARVGLHPAWGLAFVLTPATITSLDRMTVDIALAALTAAFALYAEVGPKWKVIAVLGCAALTRETSLPILGAYALFLVTRRRFLDGAWVAAAALPALAWHAYVTRARPHEPPTLSPVFGWIPLEGLVNRIFHPVMYSLPLFQNAVAIGLNYAALAAVIVALILAGRLALRRRWDAQASAIYALAVAALFVRDPSVWEDVYAFSRPLTPLMLLIALQDFGRRPWLALAPMLLLDARISLNLASQILGVARGLTGL